MKKSLDHFLTLWWGGFSECVPYDARVDQLRMAASCMWLVGNPDCPEEKMDKMITEWLEVTHPM